MKRYTHILALILITLTAFILSSCTLPASKNQFITMTPTLLSSVEQTYAEKTSTEIANPNATAVKQTNPSEYAEFTNESPEEVPTFPTFTPSASENSFPTSTPLSFNPTQAPQNTLSPIQQTPLPTTPSTTTQSITHIVAYGESIWCLARRYNIDPTALLNANGLNSQSWLNVDQSITIPSGVDTFPGQRNLSAHPTSYTVSYGDSLASIACLFGDLYPSEIANANGQSASWQPGAGAVIQIP